MPEFTLSPPEGVSFGVCRFEPDLVIDSVRSKNRIPKNARSVVVFSIPYRCGGFTERNLSLYAMLPDYHEVAMGILKKMQEELQKQYPDASIASFCDASPIREVEAAARAGLGTRGKNGLVIVPQYGSFVFLGELVTDIDLPAFCGEVKYCEGCSACIAACPTGALSAEGVCRAACRSEISQKKGELTEGEKISLKEGGLVWGCDCCLLACPYNRDAAPTPIAAFYEDVEPMLTLSNLDRLMKNRAFAWRGRSVLTRNLELLK